MSKFKGILKKTSGEFKKHYFKVTVAALFTTFAGCMASVIGGTIVERDLKNDYKKSDVFQNYVSEQQIDIEEQYNNGEISLGEYIKKFDEAEKKVDVMEVIKLDLEGNEEYQARLKSVDKWNTSAIALGAITGVNMGAMILYAPLYKKLEESSKKDLEAAEKEFKNADDGSKKKKSKKHSVSEVSEEKELKNIDEYYPEEFR